MLGGKIERNQKMLKALPKEFYLNQNWFILQDEDYMDSFLRAFHKPLLTLVTAVFNYIKLQIFISKFTPQLTKITGIYF